jgi:hypothetical protein
MSSVNNDSSLRGLPGINLDPLTGSSGPKKTSDSQTISQSETNFEAKEATQTSSQVEEKSLDEVQKSKLTLSNVANGIKNLFSKLINKLTSLIRTAASLNKEELDQICAAAKKNAVLGASIGGLVVGWIAPGAGNATGAALGTIIGGAIGLLITLNKISLQHEARLEELAKSQNSAPGMDAAAAPSQVKEKSLDEVRKTKLTLSNIASGIKNLLSKLVSKLVSLLKIVITLGSSEGAQLIAGYGKGKDLGAGLEAITKNGSEAALAMGVGGALVELYKISNERAAKVEELAKTPPQESTPPAPEQDDAEEPDFT